MSQSSAVQIVEKVGGRYELNEDALKGILQQNNALNKKVAVLSVAGAKRKGKSFFLSNCARYMTNKSDWMADDASVTGFAWKQSTDSVTDGIHMWSEPFIANDANGEEVAILLMDTEGAFDQNSSISQCATIFGLSALLSSVSVCNVMQDIQEDTLNHLQIFASYGSYALDEDNSSSPYQSLLFLVRDYQNTNTFGMEGGEELLKKIKLHAESSGLMTDLRRNIRRSFTDIKCCLLPDPGKQIKQGSEGNITVKQMDAEFKMCLETLIPQLMNNLIRAKEVGGNSITGAEFLALFREYANIFASGKVPEPKTIYDATVEATHDSALKLSLEQYNNTMKERFSQLSDRQYFEVSKLRDLHKEIKSDADKKFVDIKKMGSLPKYRDMLKEKIEELFNDTFLVQNQDRIEIERGKKATEEAERKRIEEKREAKREQERLNREFERRMDRERKERKEERERRDKEWQQQMDRQKKETEERKANAEEALRNKMEQARLVMGGQCYLKTHTGKYVRTYKSGDVWPIDESLVCGYNEKWCIENYNGKVVFKTVHDNYYLSAKEGGLLYLTIRVMDCSKWKPAVNDDGTCSFLSVHGKWLCAGFSDKIMRTWTDTVNPNARFILQEWSGPMSLSGHLAGIHFLKTHYGKYIRSDGVDSLLIEESTEKETFWRIEDRNGKVVLKSGSGWLCAKENNSVFLGESSPDFTDAQWKPFANDDGTYSFESVAYEGRWLSARQLDGKICTRRDKGAHERFTLIRADRIYTAALVAAIGSFIPGIGTSLGAVIGSMFKYI